MSPNVRNDIHFKVSKIEFYSLFLYLYAKWEHIVRSLVLIEEGGNECFR